LGGTAVAHGTGARRIGGGAVRDGGAAYDPATGRWHPIAPAPVGVRPAGAASVWTGRQLFVFAGATDAGAARAAVAGLYDPATDSWTVTGPAPLRPFGSSGEAVWTGRQVIVAGLSYDQARLEVAAYDPASGVWSELEPPIVRRHPPEGFAIVATSDGVLLWSLWGRQQRTGRTYTDHSGVDVFRLGADGSWRNVTGGWPQGETVAAPIFTGTEILLAPGQEWCGPCSPPAPSDANGYAVDPATLRITEIPHGPLDDLGPQVLWTGADVLSFNWGGFQGGPGASRVLPGDVALWSPRTRRWARGPHPPLPAGDLPAVWAAGRLYVLADRGGLEAYRPGTGRGAGRARVRLGVRRPRVTSPTVTTLGRSILMTDSVIMGR
ncbi:MAG: hypothetical protein ACRDL5_18890, partial [Solirubrobacteraceae bacterium]